MAFRTKRGGGRRPPQSDQDNPLKIKLRGRDGAPIPLDQLREALLEAARELSKYETGYRAKSATLYVTLVDDHGERVRINERNELTIYAYQSAADEHGID